MPKSLKSWQREAHALAREKGFYDDVPDPRDPTWLTARLALIHSEISEAVECVRNGYINAFSEWPEHKPEGLGIELADVFLRLADLAESLGLDLDELVTLKHEYNRTRPRKHGKVL